ncbi:hypothetical protein [Rheinheimera sp.]|uniref:hypothetical protein n=1 Tax=Rheinheimera sp. TaxID=1869214 RepID=UPI003D2B82B8
MVAVLTNFHVNAGHAAARLRQKLEGLQIMAVVGYTPAAEFISLGLDKAPEPVMIPHWRTGTVSQFQPDEMCREIVLQFQWTDETGEADTGVFEDEDITLLLAPDQLHLLDRFK